MKWFPLDRVGELEAALADLVAAGTIERRRDALAVCFGLHGLRVGEVVKLENRHLFRPTRTLDVETLKRGRDRKIELDETLVAALDAWQGDAKFYRQDATSPLLPNRRGRPCRRDQFERFARRLSAEIIGEPLKFHALRHTFAMRLYQATNDLFLVQQSLGHRSVKSTEVYARSLAAVPSGCRVKLQRKNHD